MKKWSETINFNAADRLIADTFTEHSVFFDIETTGFSPSNTSIYLIGCARRSGYQIILEQFFAESPAEEEQIITSFLSVIKNCSTILTYNGVGFDVPYLKAKCDLYGLGEDFSKKEYIDFYKIASSLKFLLKLSNYKQKSLEAFLSVRREDVLNGGELINVYKAYVRRPSEEKMLLLKRHNYEDVMGMIGLIPLLGYSSFLNGGYSVTSIESSLYTACNGTIQKEILLSFKNDIPVPKRVSCGCREFYLACNGYESRISVRLFEGELKFFFKNYQDYYYLPEEDTAIHKDLAAYVDKDFRVRASASNCYTKKNSLFVPQYEIIMGPAFREKHNDKKTYFELSESFTESDVMIRRYAAHIIKLMSTQKYL